MPLSDTMVGKYEYKQLRIEIDVKRMNVISIEYFHMFDTRMLTLFCLFEN